MILIFFLSKYFLQDLQIIFKINYMRRLPGSLPEDFQVLRGLTKS